MTTPTTENTKAIAELKGSMETLKGIGWAVVALLALVVIGVVAINYTSLATLKEKAATTDATLTATDKTLTRIDATLTTVANNSGEIKTQVARLDEAGKRLSQFADSIEEKKLIELAERMEKAIAKLEKPAATSRDLSFKVMLPHGEPRSAPDRSEIEFVVLLPRSLEREQVRAVSARVASALPNDVGVFELSAFVDGKSMRLRFATSGDRFGALVRVLTTGKPPLPVDVLVTLSEN